MSQPAMDTNVVTTQPLINSPINAEPNLGLENGENVITNQPLLSDPNNEERKEKKFSQFNPSKQKLPEKRNQESNGDVAESCVWCCFACNDCAQGCDCTGWECTGCECTGCECTGCECTGCCDENDGCCESGPSGDNIDSNDVVDCLECCGACFEICSGCCSD